MQVGISNAGEVSRVYLSYKCRGGKKKGSLSVAELVLPVLTMFVKPWAVLSFLGVGLCWLQGVAELSLPPTKSQHSVVF